MTNGCEMYKLIMNNDGCTNEINNIMYDMISF